MLKIIIPLAGPSELFSNAGYYYPKPLIEINGKIMIEHVLKNPANIQEPHQFIFIINSEESSKYHLDNVLKLLSPNCEIIKLKKPTKGGLCSTLMAIDKINVDDSMLILNGDQILDIDFEEVNKFWKAQSSDAGLLTFTSVHPRWSYARIENEAVVQTAEKNPISNHAIAGYYFFKNAANFFTAAYDSIKNDVQLNGMFFIAPVINQYILQNKTVKALTIKANTYHSFYSPQMVAEYERQCQLL